MTMHHIIWRSPEHHTINVADEGPNAFGVQATPVITSFYWGITVGFTHRGASSFGTWLSSNTTDLINAWRVAQILPRVKTMRNSGGGYDSTMCGLVIAMRGDRHEDRMRERARDLGMTVPEFEQLLAEVGQLWPNMDELLNMWDLLSHTQQEETVSLIRNAIEAGHIHSSSILEDRLETASLRIRTHEEQKQHENDLIEASREPTESLRQLMMDIGVSNLLFTVGIGEMGDPSHFDFAELDKEIMGALIGTYGFSQHISLLTTAKNPDDPTAHHIESGIGMTVYSTNFGEAQHPIVHFAGQWCKLVYVTWSHGTERYLVAVRPVQVSDRDDSQDMVMNLPDLRDLISTPVGTRALWLEKPRRRMPMPWRR